MGARLLSMVVFLCFFVSLSADVCAVAATWHSAGGLLGTNGFRVFVAEMHLCPCSAMACQVKGRQDVLRLRAA